MLLLRIPLVDGVDCSGTPEIGGWTTRELIQILRGLAGVNIVGADVVKKAGGVVKTIEFVPGYSTSRIVEKIKKT